MEASDENVPGVFLKTIESLRTDIDKDSSSMIGYISSI